MEKTELQTLRELLLEARTALLPYMQVFYTPIENNPDIQKPMYNHAAIVVMKIDKVSNV